MSKVLIFKLQVEKVFLEQTIGQQSVISHFLLYIYIYMGWVQVTPSVILNNVTPLNIF